MPVTSTRRISTSSASGLSPFIGLSSTGSSPLSTTSYRRSVALSPSRFGTSSTSSLSSSSSSPGSSSSAGYYRSLSSSTGAANFYSSRNSIGAILENRSNESSRYPSKYSSTTFGGESAVLGGGSAGGAGGGGTAGGRCSSVRASIARSVATSGADFYEKNSPAHYIPKCELLTRSRSSVIAGRGQDAYISPSSSSSNICRNNNINNNNTYIHNNFNNTAASASKSSALLESEKRRSSLHTIPPDYNNNNNSSRTSANNNINKALNSHHHHNNNNNNNNSTTSSSRGDVLNHNGSVVANGDDYESSSLGSSGSRRAAEASNDIRGSSSIKGGQLSSGGSTKVINKTHYLSHTTNNNHAILPVSSLSSSLSAEAKQKSESATITNKTPSHLIISYNSNNNIRINKSNNITKITLNAAVTPSIPASASADELTNNNIRLSKDAAAFSSPASSCESAVLLNNNQCTSNNRAIVHVFSRDNSHNNSTENNQNNNSSCGRIENGQAAHYLSHNGSGSANHLNHRQVMGPSRSGNRVQIDQQQPNNINKLQRDSVDGVAVADCRGLSANMFRTTTTANHSSIIGNGGGLSMGTTSNGKLTAVRRNPEVFLKSEYDQARQEWINKTNTINAGVAGDAHRIKIDVKTQSEDDHKSNHNSCSNLRQSNGNAASGGGLAVSTGHTSNGGCKTTTATELEEMTHSILKGHKRYNGRTSIEQGTSEKMDIDPPSEEETPTTMTSLKQATRLRPIIPNGVVVNGVRKKEGLLTNGKVANSSPTSSSSSSSSSSLMDTTSEANGKPAMPPLEDDIKFIDSDDNNEPAQPPTNNSTSSNNGSSDSVGTRLSRFNKSISSTLDSLKSARPIVTGLKYNNLHNQGHHTLPHNYTSGNNNSTGSGVEGVNRSRGFEHHFDNPDHKDYTKKYNTLSNLPSRTKHRILNGFAGSSIAVSEAAAGGDDGGVRQHELIIKENVDVMASSSEPPNDKLSGKSWEVNNHGITGGSSAVRTTTLRNALPPVSPIRSWERDRPRYRELLDAEPATSSTTASLSPSKYDAYDRDTTDSADGLCGLRNIGNTCFMNSVIQCLSHTSDLTKFLRSQREPKSTTKDQRIFAEFVKLIKDMWSTNTRSVTPSELKSAFSSKHRMYSGCGQQDAQEFLRFFLDALHSACNEGIKQEGQQLDDNMSENRRADLMWDWYSKTESSVIKDLFVGQLRSTLKCTVCGNTSVTFDPFWDLSVPLPPSSSRCKLENCLELFIREEVLDGDEMPTCSKCKQRRKSTKNFTIQRFPKYLVIHLKRFSETRWSKLTNVVEFPTGDRELNLAPYASGNATMPPNYSLYAISNHMGSTAGGHYVALCKHPQSGKWHEFNDNHVGDASESSLISSSAYLLFYERA